MRHSDQTKGIQEGVVEQSRVLLAILRYLPTGRGLHDSGSASRFNIKPEEARVLEDVSLERLLLETSEPVSCGAGTSHGMACLLKFGTQGLAALYRSEQQDDH